MSASQAKRGPLPAAFIALAVTAGASAAQAGEPAPLLDVGFLTDQQDERAPQIDGDARGIVDWLAILRSQFVTTAEISGDLQAIVSDRVDVLTQGLAVLGAWSGDRTQTIAALAADIDAKATLIAKTDPAFAGIAQMALAATAKIQDALETQIGSSTTQLTGFGMRMVNAMPGQVAADTSIHAKLQPIYDAVGKAFTQSQRIVAAVNWASINGSLSVARAATVDASHLAAGFDAIQAGFAQLKAVADRNADLIGAAKTEFLRAVAETTKLAFATLPAISTPAGGGDEAMIMPAADSAMVTRPFGRRIDYLGMAQRWVGVP